MKLAGIILCGGKSTRMGADKAWLPVGEEVMLQRLARIVGELCSPVVVVAAGSQSLPELDGDVQIVRDSKPARGPLQAVRDGLSALAGDVDAAFVTGCDTPLLRPDVIRHIAAQLGEHEIAVPWIDGFPHPLTAVYRLSVRAKVDELLQQGELSLRSLLAGCRTYDVTKESVQQVDPDLTSIRNCNQPDTYQAILRELSELRQSESE